MLLSPFIISTKLYRVLAFYVAFSFVGTSSRLLHLLSLNFDLLKSVYSKFCGEIYKASSRSSEEGGWLVQFIILRRKKREREPPGPSKPVEREEREGRAGTAFPPLFFLGRLSRLLVFDRGLSISSRLARRKNVLNEIRRMRSVLFLDTGRHRFILK